MILKELMAVTEISDSDETLPPSDKETKSPLEECVQEVEWSQSPLGYFGAIQEGEVLNISYTALLQRTRFPSLCENFNICKIC
ncbi:hypothetical protein DPMN_193140 [Dreissena polymorpha]|uniref:Uncharacterized protein n=1 Tax=Dreissena polymorpha TaxID=45954 RepID=A0A9D3Y5D3_DREPO|nr:hypothetical protein DPMN_193140 [Dreissena polymorpha]